MITKFKIFESINELPKVGDYVLIKRSNVGSLSIDFFDNNIGQISRIEEDFYYVNFEKSPIKSIEYYKNRRYSINEFKYWSSDKEELEEFLAAKKFNL